jgi:plastocyanin
MSFRRTALLCGAVFLVCAAGAQAATKPVLMGPPSFEPFEKLLADPLRFFPSTITIAAGDSVAFTPRGFHNVSLPAKGADPRPFVAPTGKTSSEPDAAGKPFWHAGRPVLGFAPQMVKLNFGRSFTYNGTKGVNSGLPLADRPKPMVVKFTKPGSYLYFCELHPGMKGKVNVRAAGAKVPTAKQDAARVKREVAKAIADGKELQATKPAAGTIRVGANRGGVEALKMFPEKLEVAVGTTLTFEGSVDAHTATTGPFSRDEKDTKTYVNALAKSFESPAFDPRATYPSEPPGSAAAALTPSLHGNGFWNTGIISAVKQGGLPGSGRVTMAQAGTYTFVCLIHPFMTSTVTVR